MAGAVLALLVLASIDVMLLLPVLGEVRVIFVGCSVAVLVMVVVGFALMIAALFPGLAWFGLTGGVEMIAIGLVGAGMVALGVGLGALFALVTNLVIKLLVQYARLHFRLINTVAAQEV
jgi:uncharacterized membrane protein